MSDLQEYREPPKRALREEVIDQLKLNFAHGNIEVEEFERRIEKANGVDTKHALVALISDLPVIKDQNTPSEPGAGSSLSMVPLNTGTVQQTSTMAGILAGVSRKGVWRPARQTNVVTLMGGVDLDYSEAEMPPGLTEINAFCALGGLEIKVPEGINVEVEGIPILGGVDDKSNGVVDPSWPTLRIKAFVLLGGVDVKMAKKRKKRRKG